MSVEKITGEALAPKHSFGLGGQDASSVLSELPVRANVSVNGLAGPKLHIWASEGTKPVHFIGLTAADTKRHSRLASWSLDRRISAQC